MTMRYKGPADFPGVFTFIYQLDRYRACFKIRFFTISCLFFPTLCPMASDTYTWEHVRHKAPIYKIQDWESLQAKSLNYKNILFYLLSEDIILMDHFYSIAQKLHGSSVLPTHSKNTQIWHWIYNLKNVLMEKSYTKLVEFAEIYSLGQTDKIILILYLINRNFLAQDIFQLMKAWGISVNNTLAIKDIQSPFLSRMDMEGTLAVLSHHLAATGNPEIIDTLIEENYDSRLKTIIGGNILHSYILLSGISYENEESYQEHKKALEKIVEKSDPSLLLEKNALGYSPLSLAHIAKNKLAIEVLSDKSLYPHPVTLQKLLKEEVKPYNALWTHLNNPETDRAAKTLFKGQDPLYLTYLNFAPVLSDLVAFIKRSAQRGEEHIALDAFYNELSWQTRDFEMRRLSLLNNSMHSQEERLLQFHTGLKAVIDRNRNFSKIFSASQLNSLADMTFIEPISPDRYAFVSDLLSEAIRHSFLPAVESLLSVASDSKERREEILPGPEQQKTLSYSPDPLSLAIITYASLDFHHPLKESAKQIIRLVAQQTNVNNSYVFPLNFSPVIWSLLFGLLEETDFLLEEKKEEFTPNITFSIHKNINAWVNLIEYAAQKDFWRLRDYLISRGESEKNPADESATQAIWRIQEEALSKFHQVFDSQNSQKIIKEIFDNPSVAKAKATMSEQEFNNYINHLIHQQIEGRVKEASQEKPPSQCKKFFLH